MPETTAYCFKCKKSQPISYEEPVSVFIEKTKRTQLFAKSACPECGGNVSTILKADKKEEAVETTPSEEKTEQ